MLKKIVLNILKILFAAGIIWWLLKNGKLDLKDALRLFSEPTTFTVIILLYLIQMFLATKRWQILLQTKSKHITDTKRVVAIQWIGQFFSSALPGAVTGDLVKLSYIKKMDVNLSTKFLILSVFLDRLLGLISILLISCVASIIFYSDLIILNPEMPKIILINLLLLVCSFAGIGLFLIPHSLIDVAKRFIKFKKITALLEGFKSIQINRYTLFKLITTSTILQLLCIITFHVINYNSYESAIRIRDLAIIIPLGFISTAIPISPAGLGVGHLAFEKLFSLINQTNGATLFNNFWIFYLVMNLMGAIPYIFFKQKNKT